MRASPACVLLLWSCSVIADPSTEIRCIAECAVGTACGCPAGYDCVVAEMGDTEGICREECPDPQPEECNGVDDDCDRTIDEGVDMDGDGTVSVAESFDRDEDGFNRCGTDRCDDPDVDCMIDVDRIDCDDEDSSINPTANEECDATDHDCDGAAFPPGEPTGAECEAPRDDLCGGGQICEVDRGCIAPGCASGRTCSACGERQACEDGSCVDLDCDPVICEGMNQFCDSTSPECQDRKPNGTDCERDIECLSGFCAPGNTLELSVSGVCFEACCNDDQCPAGQHCYGPGTGARSCMVPRADTGRNAIGSGGAGASCSDGSGCRSGRCDGSTCFSACGQSSDCPVTCGLTDEGLGCGTGGEIGDMCSSGAECALGECNGSGFCPGQACTESTSCPRFDGMLAICDYGAFSAGSLQAAPACFYARSPAGFPEPPNEPHGGSCEVQICERFSDCCDPILCISVERRGCESGICVNNRCTRACCDDSTCAPFGDVCRPQRVSIEGGTFFPMYCVPPT